MLVSHTRSQSQSPHPMPSYSDRAKLIKQLSDQAYFEALKRDDAQKKDVRVGGIDGRTGRYQVLTADGGLVNSGVPLANGAPPTGDFVRGFQSPNSNAIGLGYRAYVPSEFVARNEALGDEENVIIRDALVRIPSFLFFSGSPLSGIAKSFFTISYNTTISYGYENNELVGVSEGSTDFLSISGFNTEETDPPTNIIINPITSTIESTLENLVITTTLDQLFKVVSPSIGVNQPPTFSLVTYEISFAIAQWEDILSTFEDYENWLDPDISTGYTWASSPIEIEASVFELPVSSEVDVIFFTRVAESIVVTVGDDGFFPNRPSPVGNSFEVSVRFRRRAGEGEDPLPWFGF